MRARIDLTGEPESAGKCRRKVTETATPEKHARTMISFQQSQQATTGSIKKCLFTIYFLNGNRFSKEKYLTFTPTTKFLRSCAFKFFTSWEMRLGMRQ